MAHRLFSNEGDTVITFFNADNPTPLQIHKSHPNFDEVLNICLEEVAAGKDLYIDPALFDPVEAVSKVFTPLSERISVSNRGLYFDGDRVESGLADYIVEAVSQEREEGSAWVAFMERLYQNPHQHSRDSLFNFLQQEKFSITDDGRIVGYKSVVSKGEGLFFSVHQGTAFVNGEIYENSQIPNPVGAVVTMPRSTVDDNQYLECSSGLHVGTHKYASGFTGDTVLEIHFDPRDVVSVPSDGTQGKVRVCRYVVAKVIGSKSKDESGNRVPVDKYTERVLPSSEETDLEAAYPTFSDWTDIVSDAKKQKKGVGSLIRRRHKSWTYSGPVGDGLREGEKIRTNWIVLEKP